VTLYWQVEPAVFRLEMAKVKTTGKRNKGSKSYSSKAVLKAAIKVKNCRKRSASNSNSSGSNSSKDSSDEEPPKRRHRKKVKPAKEVDEEVDNEVEEVEVEIVNSSEEERGTAERDEVSTKS
jgi:hypothetical protein